MYYVGVSVSQFYGQWQNVGTAQLREDYSTQRQQPQQQTKISRSSILSTPTPTPTSSTSVTQKNSSHDFVHEKATTHLFREIDNDVLMQLARPDSCLSTFSLQPVILN